MKAKIYLALTLICLTNIGTYAQSDDDDFRSKKNVASLSGVLSAYGSDPALGAELSYYRYFCPFLGVTAGFAYQNWGTNADKPNFEATDSRGFLYTHDDDSKLEKLNFIVGVSMRTPSIRISKNNYRLFCQCDPAALFTIPNEKFTYSRMYQENNIPMIEYRTAKNYGGKSAFWRVRSSISLGIDDGILSIGYTISNQDPLSSRRNVVFDGNSLSDNISHHLFTHEFFVSLAYGF